MAVQDLIIQKINVSVVFIDGVATYRFAPLDNLGQEISALVQLGGDFQFGNGGLYTFTFSSVDDFDSYPLRFANNELYPSFIQLLEPDSIDELERSVSFFIENNTPDIRYYSGGELVEGGTIAFVPRELWVDGPYISLLASGPTSTNSLDLNERGSYFATTPLNDGGLVAIWENSPLSNDDIVYQRFSADGYPVGDRVIVANDWDTHVASITELSSGNLVITYQDYQSGYRKAVYKIFDANDQVVTSGIASQIDVDDYVEVRSFELDSGQFVVVSNVVDNFPGMAAYGVAIRLFNADGLPLGNEVIFNQYAGLKSISSIVSLGNDIYGLMLQGSENPSLFTLNASALESYVKGGDGVAYSDISSVVEIPDTGFIVPSSDGFYVYREESIGSHYLAKYSSEGTRAIEATELTSFSGSRFLQVAPIEDSSRLAVVYTMYGGNTLDTMSTFLRVVDGQTFENLTDPVLVASGSFNEVRSPPRVESGQVFVTTSDGQYLTTHSVSLPRLTFEDESVIPVLSKEIILTGGQVERSLTAEDISDSGSQVFWSENGHIYQYFSDGPSWSELQLLIDDVYLGTSLGYLATVDTIEERDFIYDNKSVIGSLWISQDSELVDPNESIPPRINSTDGLIGYIGGDNNYVIEFSSAMADGWLSEETFYDPSILVSGSKVFVDPDVLPSHIERVYQWQFKASLSDVWLDIAGAEQEYLELDSSLVGSSVRYIVNYSDLLGDKFVLTSETSPEVVEYQALNRGVYFEGALEGSVTPYFGEEGAGTILFTLRPDDQATAKTVTLIDGESLDVILNFDGSGHYSIAVQIDGRVPVQSSLIDTNTEVSIAIRYNAIDGQLDLLTPTELISSTGSAWETPSGGSTIGTGYQGYLSQIANFDLAIEDAATLVLNPGSVDPSDERLREFYDLADLDDWSNVIEDTGPSKGFFPLYLNQNVKSVSFGLSEFVLGEAGSEFIVNQHTTGDQSGPAALALGNKEFFVAWVDKSGLDGNSNGLFGRFIDADGYATGTEFQINSDLYSGLDVDAQEGVQLTLLGSGEILAMWQSGYHQDGSYNGVFARKINLDGSFASDEFLVNQTTDQSQSNPGVASTSDGGFVAVWNGWSTTSGIYGRIFAEDGAGGQEFRIDDAGGSPSGARVAQLPDGNFAVTWISDASPRLLQAAIVDGEGNVLKRNVITGESLADGSGIPPVTALHSGDFLVLWTAATDARLYGQIFNSAGETRTDKFRVGELDSDIEGVPSVTVLADGSFVVAFASHENVVGGYGQDVYYKHFSADGVALSSQEIQGNLTTHEHQYFPSIASNETDTLLVWRSSHGQDGDGDGIVARLIRVSEDTDSELATPQISPEIISVGAPETVAGYEVMRPRIAYGDDGNALIVRRVDNGDGSLSIVGQLVSEGGLERGPEIVYETTTTDKLDIGVITALSDGRFAVTWSNSSLDGAFRFISSRGEILGDDIVIDDVYCHNPQLVELESGNLFVAWRGSDSDARGTKAKIFDSAGNALTGEFLVNTNETSNAFNVNAVELTGGNIIATWMLDHGDGSSYSIQAQLLDSSGNKIGSEFRINENTAGAQQHNQVVQTSDGGFVVLWQSPSLSNPSDGSDIVGRSFDSDGSALGPEFIVNQTRAGDQTFGHVEDALVALGDGSFFTVWTSNDGLQKEIIGQRFTTDGKLIGPEFVVNEPSDSFDETNASLSITEDGRVVASWEQLNDAGDATQAQMRFLSFPSLDVSLPIDILENMNPDVPVLSFISSDIGGDDLTFSVHGPDADYFSLSLIESSPGFASGNLNLLAVPDYETKDEYSLSLTVSDGLLTDTTAVNFSVVDLNDAPKLSPFELRLDHDELLSFDDYASGSQVSALADGTFGVFWSDNDVYFQKVSPSGELIGSPLAIATNGAYRVRNIEGLSDGSALLTYENRNFLGGSEDYRHLHEFSVETGPYAGYGIWDPLTNVRINGGEDLTPTIEGRDWSEQGFGWLGGQWGWHLDNGDVLEASFNINTLEDLPVFDAGVTTRTFRQLGDAYSDDGSPVSVTVELNGTVVFFGEVPTKLLSERPAPGPSLEPYVPPGELYAWEMPLDFTNGSYDLRIAVSGGVVDLSGSNANYQSQAQIIEVEHLDSSGLVIDADSYQLVDAIRPRIVDLEDGTYLIAWGGRASNGIEHGLGQIFTYDGVPLDGMEPFLITPDAALIPDSGLLIDTGFTIDRVGVNGDTLAVFWRGEKQNTETSESIKELHLRTYNLIDQSLVNDITLLETSDDVYFNKTLDSLGNGFLVTWTEGPEDNATLYAQAVDLLGNTVIPKTTVDVGLASNDYYHVDVITLDDGSEVPVVFWIEPDPDSDTTGLQYFATLDSDLYLASDPLLIEPEQPLNQRFAYEFFSDGAGLQLLRNRAGQTAIEKPEIDLFQWSVSDGGNDHYYGIKFFEQTLYGKDGYLDFIASESKQNDFDFHSGYVATITSLEEQQFVDATFGDYLGQMSGPSAMIGATDVNEEGVWRWFSGPEEGMLLSDGFTNWGGDAPDNDWMPYKPDGEFSLVLDYRSATGVQGLWNDGAMQSDVLGTFPFLVEYEEIPATLDYRIIKISDSQLTIDESVDSSFVVFDANAIDADGDELSYSLDGVDAALMDIDSSTGVVKFKESPDYATKDQYGFSVVASDGEAYDRIDLTASILPFLRNDAFYAEVVSASRQRVDIDLKFSPSKVLAENDAPLLLESFYFNVDVINGWDQFGSIGGSEFGFDWSSDFSAIEGLTTSLVYNADNGSDGLGTVLGYSALLGDEHVDAQGVLLSEGLTLGHLSLGASQDGFYEVSLTDALFGFSNLGEVSAEDISISFEVTNNAPVFLDVPASIDIAENGDSNELVYTIAVDDPDGDEVTLVMAGADASLFDFDIASGEIRLKNPADHETTNRYELSIQASDGRLETQQSFEIGVTDRNDQPTGVVTLTDESRVGQVLTLDWSGLNDQDGGVAQILAYSWYRDGVALGETPSATDGRDGTSNPAMNWIPLFNEDIGSQLSVEVTYLDGNGYTNKIMSQASKTIEPGVYSPLNMGVYFDGSSSAAGTPYFGGENEGTLLFTICPDSQTQSKSVLLLEGGSLDIYLDFASDGTYVIRTTTAGGDELSSHSMQTEVETTVAIRYMASTGSLEIITPHETLMLSASPWDATSGAGSVGHGYEGFISLIANYDYRDSDIDLRVLEPKTVDPDHPKLRELYDLTNIDSETSFVVDGAEEKGSYGLEFSSTVGSVGYGKPVFEQQSYTVTLAENILPTDSIFRAQALDDDSDLIVYSIIDSQYDSLFSIDSLTGEVSLLSALNYEEANQYKLTVFADDGIFGATMELVVEITDVTEYQASGRVGYWSDINHGIQGSIHFTSSDNNYAVSTNINPDTGTFFLDDLMPGDYIVEVQTDSLTGGSHKSADALAAMRLSAGLIDNPDSYSLIAADIDQNGRVTGTDALEILRIAIDHPAAKAAEFVVLDEQNGPLAIQANNVNYSNELTVSVTDNMTDLDLVAVLLGDVDGNYTDLI